MKQAAVILQKLSLVSTVVTVHKFVCEFKWENKILSPFLWADSKISTLNLILNTIVMVGIACSFS